MTTLRDRVYRWVSWSPLLFLGGLVALTYWLDAQIKVPDATRDATPRHTPDLFINNFHVTQFNASGAPQQKLTARYAEHFADDDSIEIEAPHVILQTLDQPRFAITAKHAQLTGDRQNLYLRGNVVATRDALPGNSKPGSASGESLTLHTEYLHVRPNDNTLRTDQWVSLQSPSAYIESVGMEFDRNTHIVKLHSKIQGSFQPPSH